jgi:chemotaxis protein CheD
MSSYDVFRGGISSKNAPLTTTDDGGREKLYLHPGRWHVGMQPVPAVISCLLGSCVEVCLWDRKLRIGGAVHYLLPGEVGNASPNSGLRGIGDLMAAMLDAGASPHSLVGKVFGGSCMLPELRSIHIGDRNIETARACLKQLRILILQEEVGGERGRKVTFFTDTGEACAKTF